MTVDQSTLAAVDPVGLRRFLGDHLPELQGPFDLKRLGEGQSCLTFLVRGDGWEVVLRRPPRGDLPPTAFDVTREYRVMSALSAGASGVPVPAPLALCEDSSVIGAPFYLMEKVDGVVVRDDVPSALSSAPDRARMARLTSARAPGEPSTASVRSRWCRKFVWSCMKRSSPVR